MSSPSAGSSVVGVDALGFPCVEFGACENDTVDGLPAVKHAKVKTKSGGFQSFQLSLPVFKAIMRLGYQLPTPIQRKAIPQLLAGHDCVCAARTGSGKTAAFLIPLVEKLSCSLNDKSHSASSDRPVRGLVLSPTRELAIQTLAVCNSLCKFTPLTSCLLVGGSSMNAQFEALSRQPHILIATPGRLMHHLIEIPQFTIRHVETVVYDEADRLFELGFAPQLFEILKFMNQGKSSDSGAPAASNRRQSCVFSATLPSSCIEFTRVGLIEPKVIRLDLESKISDQLEIAFIATRKEMKQATLVYLIKEYIPQQHEQQQKLIKSSAAASKNAADKKDGAAAATSDSPLIIVFCATRHQVEYLHTLLSALDLSVTCVYGQLDATARKINIGMFRGHKRSVLLVTDVAARGLDLPGLDWVLNYDFPATPKLALHRIGRTGRAGRAGTAISLVAPDEMPYMLDLHLFLGKQMRYIPIQNPDEKLVKEAQQTAGQAWTGVAPRSLIEEHDLSVQSVRQSNSDLWRLAKVSERAYSLYHKTREPASMASTYRSREMNSSAQLADIGVHPMFRKAVEIKQQQQQSQHQSADKESANNKDESEFMSSHLTMPTSAVDAFVAQVRAYSNPRSKTIFELQESHHKKDARHAQQSSVMAVKRAHHDAIIRKKQENAAIQQKQIGSAMLERSTTKQNQSIDDSMSDVESDDDEKQGEVELEEDQVNSEAEQSDAASHSVVGQKRKAAAQPDIDAQPNDAETAPSRSSQVDALLARRHQSLQQLSTDARPRKSKKQRLMEKQGSTGKAAPSAHDSMASVIHHDDDSIHQNQSMDADNLLNDDKSIAASQHLRGPMGLPFEPLRATKYKSEAKFFLSDQIADEHTEKGLEINPTRSDGNAQPLTNALSLDMMGDDAQSILKQTQKVTKWDSGKRNFVTETVNLDKFAKQRNESGQLVKIGSKGEKPQLYDKWLKSKKQSKGSTLRVANPQDEDETASGGIKAPKSTKSKSQKGLKSELKSVDEVRKQRKQTEKNKMHNMSKKSRHIAKRDGPSNRGAAMAARSAPQSSRGKGRPTGRGGKR